MCAWREGIERDGFGVRRGLLGPAEIEHLRAGLREHFVRQGNWVGLGKHQPGAAVEIPAINWIFSHPPIVDSFRALTGSDRLVFTGNCDAHLNMLSWWHKDTSEMKGGCFPGDYFGNTALRVYRAGIYLQNHDTDGHGLHVRYGSHRTRSISAGKVETLRTRAGDVVFFDIRLTHAGQLADPVERLLLKGSHRAPALAWRLKETWRVLRGKQDKLSIFFTYGAPGPDTEHYCAFEAAEQRYRCASAALLPGLVEALSVQRVDCNSWLMPA